MSSSEFGRQYPAARPLVVFAVGLAIATLFGNHGLSAQDAVNQQASKQQKPDKQRPGSNQYPERSLKEDWYKFQPAGADAAFEMPAKPRLIERSFTPVDFEPAIKVHLYIASVGKGSATFIFGWHDLHTPPDNAKHRKDILDGAVRGSIANVLGTLTSEQNSSLQGNGGRKYTYLFTRESTIYKVAAEVYLVGERQYQFSLITKQNEFDDDVAARFAGSVKLSDPEGDLPPRPRKKADG